MRGLHWSPPLLVVAVTVDDAHDVDDKSDAVDGGLAILVIIFFDIGSICRVVAIDLTARRNADEGRSIITRNGGRWRTANGGG